MRLKGTQAAPRDARQTRHRGQIEDGPVPLANATVRRHGLDAIPEFGIDRGWPLAWEAEVPAVDARGDPIDGGRTAAEGDDEGCVCRVWPHTGKGEQAVDRPGHATELDDRAGEVTKDL